MAEYDLKSADEIKEYLKNLLIGYQFGCLHDKKPEVCHLLGDYREGIDVDYENASKMYKMNCDEHSYARSCAKYGGYCLAGRGCEKDTNEANKYLRKSCDLGDIQGCLHAGILAISKMEYDKDRTTQIATGIKMLSKACDEQEEKACYHLSGVFLKGIEGHIEKNQKEAYRLSLKACELGNPFACGNVSVMHRRGDGVQKNEDLANTFLTRAQELLAELKEARRQLQFQQGIDP